MHLVMTPILNFLVLALVVVMLPIALRRFSGLKGLVPLVAVQLSVGIVLGPTVFGRIAPDLFQQVVNPASLASLAGVGSIALLIFGLITGMHLGPEVFRGSGRMFTAVAATRVLFPTALGCLAGLWILGRHPDELPRGITEAEYAAAIGICTGMTALPVLGAILREMNLLSSRLGQVALGVAGVCDVALWGLMSILLAVNSARAGGSAIGLASLLLFPLYLFVMIRFVRPLLDTSISSRLRDGEIEERTLAIVGAVTIASALAVEAMGLHYLIGAFVTGAVMPMRFRTPILDRLQALTLALLMPFFFTLTGMRILINPTSPEFLDVFLISTGVAVGGVILSTAVAARLTGASWPFALALGSLLQTKGLMEVIALTILMDAGIISANVFSALVLMAIVSTALAMPLVRLMLAQRNAQVNASFGAVPAIEPPSAFK